MINRSLMTVLFSGLLLLAACGGSDSEGPMATQPMATAPVDLPASLASESRSAEDRARDAGRRPAQIIEFMGIKPGMRVIDVIAAGGYYTEVLSLAVGASGSVVAQNPQAVLEFRDGANEKAISARLAGNRLPNVSRVNGNFDAVPTDGGLYNVVAVEPPFGFGHDEIVEIDAIKAVPEPSSMLLLSLGGFAALAWCCRRSK